MGKGAGFAGSWFFVAFDRDTLPKQVSLLGGYCYDSGIRKQVLDLVHAGTNQCQIATQL